MKDTATIDRARRGAVQRWAHVADEETVEACFDAVLRQYATAPVRTFLPVLTERRLREVFAPV